MNWTILTADDLKTAGHGTIIDRARTAAVGSVDPVDEDIANSVAQVRRAVAKKNKVDADEAKVPNSLKGLTLRMVVYALHERIRFPLSPDQVTQRKDDVAELKSIAKDGGLVEAPDTVGVSAVPQNFGSWNSENKILGRTHPVPAPGRQFPAAGGYANPDAPEDQS